MPRFSVQGRLSVDLELDAADQRAAFDKARSLFPICPGINPTAYHSTVSMVDAKFVLKPDETVTVVDLAGTVPPATFDTGPIHVVRNAI